MTQSLNRQNMTSDDVAAQIEIYDSKGRIDQAQTDAANKEIFHDINTVYITQAAQKGPLSKVINAVATAAARAATKAAIRARLK